MSSFSENETPSIARRYQKLKISEIGFEIGKNIEFVVEHSLCHGCGACEAVCPISAIKMRYENKQGIYLPDLDARYCTDCELCVQVCSGFELDLTDRSWGEGGLKQHALVGPHVDIYKAHTADAERRERAASGGMVTEIVAHLLSTKRVDGAILVRMKANEPLVAEGYIAYSVSELAPSQKSKYCPVPLDIMLADIIYRSDGKKYVFVGLPHHVHGLRYIQRLFPHVFKSIPYVLSIFTAHVPSQRATEFILYKMRIKQEDVSLLEYRGGGNPGRMRIVTNGGVEHLVPHLHWMYSGHSFPKFFYPVREWLYFDKMSEWADFSCGDNWSGGIGEQKGESSVVTRSLAANLIIQEMIDAGKVEAVNITADDLVRDQGLRTKLNIGKRLEVWKRFGRKVPVYNREFERKSSGTLRTTRFALNVLLSERKVPYQVMNFIIKTDYYMGLPLHYLNRIRGVLSAAVNVFLPCKEEIQHKSAKYKVVLIGGYGHKDIGDESMPHAVRINLRKALGDEVEVVMLSYDPACTQEVHGEKSRRDFNHISYGAGASLKLKVAAKILTLTLLAAAWMEKFGIRLRLWGGAREALNEICTADIILNVGGGNINSMIPGELYKKCTTYLVASILGKPVFVSGQTMGPYYGFFDKAYARYCLNKVAMISFRDKKVSHDRLVALGVNRPVMFDAADDAITLNGISDAKARLFLENETGKSFEELTKSLVILLNLKASLSLFKGAGRDGNLDNEVSLMAEIADALCDNYGCTIIYFPTDFSSGVDDRVLHAAAYGKMKNKGAAYCLNNEYSDTELIGMINCADVVIGGRYHFNVFAASCFKPFLGISSGVYQRTKLQGLADLCGLPECYVDADMEFATIQDVWPQVCQIIDGRGEIEKALQRQVPALKNASLRIVSEVAKELRCTLKKSSKL